MIIIITVINQACGILQNAYNLRTSVSTLNSRVGVLIEVSHAILHSVWGVFIRGFYLQKQLRQHYLFSEPGKSEQLKITDKEIDLIVDHLC